MKRKWRIWILGVVFSGGMWLPAARAAAPDAAGTPAGGYTPEQIAEMINNPLSELWMINVQNDTYWLGGDLVDAAPGKNPPQNVLNLQPVLSLQLTPGVRWITRPVLPIMSVAGPEQFIHPTGELPPPGTPPDFHRETGLGDIAWLNVFTSNEGAKPPDIWGVGGSFIMDTATDPVMGTGKWSAGPAAVAMHLGEVWIYGVLFQHWWSFAGEDRRSDVNLTDVEPFLRRMINQTTSVGFMPSCRYNWEAGDWIQVPVGLGIDHLMQVGPVPLQWGAEFYYNVARQDLLGSEYQFRVFLNTVVPSPAWTRRALFGG